MYDEKIANDPIKFGVKFNLYPYQQEVVEAASQQKAYALLFDQGLGKKIITTAVIGRKVQMGEVTKVLIICPKAHFVEWHEHIGYTASFKSDFTCLEGTKKQKMEQLREVIQTEGQPLRVVCVNYESVASLLYMLKWFAPHMLILDKCESIEKPNLQKSQAVEEIAQMASHKMILSQVRTTGNKIYLYNAYRLLDDVWEGLSYMGFWKRYGDSKSEEVHRAFCEKIAPYTACISKQHQSHEIHWELGRKKIEKGSQQKRKETLQDIQQKLSRYCATQR